MLKYLIKNNKFHAITGLIALIMFSLNKFLLSILILFDLAVANGEIFIDFRYVILINGLYILYYFIFNYFSEFLLDKFMIKSQNVLNQRVFIHIVSNYKQNLKGNSYYNTIFTNDISLICETYLQGIINSVYFLVSFISASILILNINKYMLLYLVVISFITLFLQRALVNTLASKQFAYNESLTSILKVLNETLVNKSYIRIYRLNNYFLNKFNKVSEESTDKLFDITFKEDMIEVINQTSAIIIEIGMYLLGIVLIFNNNLSTESLLAIVTSASSITLPVYSFSRVLSKFKKTKAVRDKIRNILKEEKNDNKNYNIDRIKSLHLLDYMGKYENKNVNKPINENIENDKKYLIIGSNGSGKSTLLKNLLLEHNNYQGDININQNIELKDINVVDYLKNISYVSQDQVLINGSIKENIILGYEYDEVKYESIKKLMGLDKFDDSVPLDSERVKLSGGEKQKIVIGRAIYKSSDFIILDEPFSNLDYNTSTRLLDYLIKEDKRGLIVVEHKINKEEYGKFDNVIELNRVESIM